MANVSGRVLEAGVGTRRMLIPLIKQGVKVDGVDLSPQMLKQCRVNLNKHQVKAMLFEQDLIHLSLPHKYDAIIMPAGSFCLLQRNMAAKVLKNFYNHLNLGGKIIIDLEMPISFQTKTTTVHKLPVTEDVEIVLTCHSEKIEWLAQKTSYINKYELKEKKFCKAKGQISFYTGMASKNLPCYWSFWATNASAMRLAMGINNQS